MLTFVLNSQKDPGFCKPSGKMFKFWHGGIRTVPLCVSPVSHGCFSNLCSFVFLQFIIDVRFRRLRLLPAERQLCLNLNHRVISWKIPPCCPSHSSPWCESPSIRLDSLVASVALQCRKAGASRLLSSSLCYLSCFFPSPCPFLFGHTFHFRSLDRISPEVCALG